MCTKLVCTKTGIDMHHISTEREYFSLSIDVFDFENKYGGNKLYLKRSFFFFFFLVVALHGLKFWMHKLNMTPFKLKGVILSFKSSNVHKCR